MEVDSKYIDDRLLLYKYLQNYLYESNIWTSTEEPIFKVTKFSAKVFDIRIQLKSGQYVKFDHTAYKTLEDGYLVL